MSRYRLQQFILVNKKSIFSFLMVGGFSAVINFMIFGFCWKGVHLIYSYAVSIAYVASVVFHFFANKHITFKSQKKGSFLQTIKYLIMVIINYFITYTIVQVIVETFHLPPYFGIAFAIGVTAGVGYLMSLFWIFPSKLDK